MASKYVALAIFAIILPAVAMATEYVVGDGDGWKVGPNYTQWASGKEFYVGDKLVFHYQPPDNVYKVDGNGFKECKASGNGLISGNDTITLSQPGKKWYICDYNDHCANGQKLVITVLSNGPTASPPPNQPPPNHSNSLSISSFYNIIPAALLILGFISV